MRVVYFQAQTMEDDITPMLREIDPMCPKPQALEGGDGNGGLWQCMIDVRRTDALLAYTNPNFMIKSILLKTTDVDDNHYNPTSCVEWVFADTPILIPAGHIE